MSLNSINAKKLKNKLVNIEKKLNQVGVKPNDMYYFFQLLFLIYRFIQNLINLNIIY